jgi:predicted dinucleotide-binding enzyme
VRDHAAVTEIPVAATGADLVLLAVPWSSVLKVADQLADLDTVVVDATNLLAGDRRGHDRDPGSSGAERLAARMPRERLVKAFNTTGSAT